jgi:Ca-activated chloride channel family protein
LLQCGAWVRWQKVLLRPMKGGGGEARSQKVFMLPLADFNLLSLMTRIHFLSSLMALCLVPMASAQVVGPPTIFLPPSQGQGKLKPMTVQSVDAEIKIRGHLATTTLNITFANPNARIIEGELIFPLGEGQTISGYALEIEGKLRQAVVVPKETGREIFEEVVRQGIDPGLAELTKGNVFRTRIYPIPANGTKRVAVSFEQVLGEDAQGLRYLLPLAFPQKLTRFHVRAEVVKQEVAPLPETKDAESLSFEKWRDSFVAEITKENYKANKPLAFTIPKVADRPQTLLVSEPLEPAKMYFNARVEPTLPGVLPATVAAQRIALFYDASGSAEKRDRKRELAFLETWMKSLGNVVVELVAFRNEAEAPVQFEIKDGDASALRKAIEALPLDGGTSLGCINVNQVKGADLVVVMTDGFSNFSTEEPGFKAAEGTRAPRWIFLHAAAMVETNRLERLARQGNGVVVNLLALDNAAALPLVQTGGTFQYLGAKIISGKAEDLAPALPTLVAGQFTLAGRCEGRTELELSFGYGGQSQVTKRLVLDPADSLAAEHGDFLRRAWAQQRIAELAIDPKRNAEAIQKLGMEHRVVTSSTSLLVLDRIEDYVRYHIEPVEADLKKQYEKMLAKEPKNRQNKDEAKHLDEIAKQWKEFQAWHQKRHPWLETVLAPTAKSELKLWQQMAKAENSKGKPLFDNQLLTEAKSILEECEALQDRWSKEGKKPETRQAWEQAAVAAMLRLDTLEQKRMELVATFPQFKSLTTPLNESGVGRGNAPGAAASASATADPFAAPPPVGYSPPPASPASPMPATGAVPSRHVVAQSVTAGEGESRAQPQLTGSIKVKPWNPDTPYLKKIRAAEEPYTAYLKERKANASSSAFFLDCADYFWDDKKDPRLALRVVSNLAEMELESAPLLRILAYRLMQKDRYDLAVPLLESVLEMRGEEPQSRRDLAIALTRMKNPDPVRAAGLLWEVIRKPDNGRFKGIEIIVLHELNDMFSRLPADYQEKVRQSGIEKRFLNEPVPVDLRVVLSWDADATDIDLWVTDPAGETCIYSHNRTKTGGHMSNDFTQGYGPEVFTIRRALPGTYTVQANYYGNRQQKFAGATTVQLEFQTSFGQANAKRQAITRRLKDNKEVIDVGKFTFKP